MGRQILLNVRTNVLLINAELISLGIQTPYRSALETFPPFRDLHLNIKLNINRHTSNLGKQITDDEDSIEKIKIKTDEEDSPKKKKKKKKKRGKSPKKKKKKKKKK